MSDKKNLISFLFFLRHQRLVGLIKKNLAHFAHRSFPTQAKFAHWSENPGYTTGCR
jgi:hypothetical protein